MAFSKRKKIIIIILAIIGIVVTAFFGWKAYRDSNPQSYINFKQFSPTKIVGGLHVTEKNVEAWESHPLLWFRPYSVIIRLSLESPFSFIAESKSESDGTVDPTRFPCSTEGARCFSKTTPQGQTYLLTHHYSLSNFEARPFVYDELTEQSIAFVRDGTGISVVISDMTTPIADEDWSAMIDSFVPTTFTDLRVKHMRPGP